MVFKTVECLRAQVAVPVDAEVGVYAFVDDSIDIIILHATYRITPCHADAARVAI